MIIYSPEEGIIKPYGIKKLDGTKDVNFKLPHIAIGIIIAQSSISFFSTPQFPNIINVSIPLTDSSSISAVIQGPLTPAKNNVIFMSLYFTI